MKSSSILSCALALLSLTSFAHAQWDIQLVPGGSGARDPRISGNNVAWMAFDIVNFEYDLYFYNGTTPTKIGDDIATDIGGFFGSENVGQFDLSGSNVVWRSGSDLFLYDGSTTTQLASNALGEPRVSGSNVTWAGDVSGDSQIFLYDGSSTTPLPDSTGGQAPKISGTNVVWREVTGSISDEFTTYDLHSLSFYDGATTTGSYTGLTNVGLTSYEISGSNVVMNVWQLFDSGEFVDVAQEVYYYGGGPYSTPISGTGSGFDDFGPRISGSNVASPNYFPGGVLSYNGTTEQSVYLGPYDYERYPDVSGSNVVWQNGDDLYFYDGDASTLLFSTPTFFVSGARVSDSNVVWASDGGLFLATPEPAGAPPDLFDDPNHLAEFLWTGADDGTTWQTAANWFAPTFPGGYPYTIPTIPDDPARIDVVEDEPWPVVGANLSSALASNLTVDINGSDMTVASVKMGGTGVTAVTTSIDSTTGHMLVLENQELNDKITNPGDPMQEPPLEPEPIWSFNQGRALIWSTGTTGSVNRIDADIKANDDVDVEGDRDLHIYGDVVEGDRLTAGGDPYRETSLSSLLSNDAWLHIDGDIVTSRFDEEPADGTQDRDFKLNSARGVLLPEDPQNPPLTSEEVNRSGRIDVHGRLTGDGYITIGMDTTGGNSRSLGTVILRGDSGHPDDVTPLFSGRVIVNRGNLVLDHDNALGGGDVKTGGPTGSFGFNFISTDDARIIANNVKVAQWQTVRGAADIPGLETIGDHSIEFSGEVVQTNTRGWINLLPYNHLLPPDDENQTGKTLTLSGPQYPLQGGDNGDEHRIYTIDGTGRTLITGGIHDRPPGATFAGDGHFRKRGTGTVVIDYDEANTSDTPTDHAGSVWMEGGNLHYGDNTDLPVGSILSRGGAVGVDDTTDGVINNSTFLAKLNNSSNPNATFTSPYFQEFGDRIAFTTFSSGGLMLAPDEYGEDLNFNVGDLVNAANMTLAAHETGSEYTGTITPNTSIATNPNTYQLGGGSGRLTLPDDDQLTGANALLVTNGGEIRLEGTNNFTGATRVVGKFLPTNQAAAAADRVGGEIAADDDDNEGKASDVYQPSKLTVLDLADGASAVGNSTLSDPANLHIQGSTLRYEGPAVTTNRLFTIGTAGATIDASGDGALVFNSTSALGVDVAEDRDAYLTGNHSDLVDKLFGRADQDPAVPFSTEDLVPGMRIQSVSGASSGWVDGLVVESFSAPDVISVGGAASFEGWTTTSQKTIDFGPAPARTLTLSGSNTDLNTLKPSVGDASDITETGGAAGGAGSVGIRKSGVGTWILAGDNTYSGLTTVAEGLLILDAGGSTGSGLTTVEDGGILGGTGTVKGDLTVRDGGTVGPGLSAGTLEVLGSYVQEAGSSFEVEIATLASFDVLDVMGTATLGGSLDVLLIDGFEPPPDSSFEIITATGGVSGTFSTLAEELPALSSGLLWMINYGEYNVVLSVVSGLAGDYNGDGFVDAADYTVWRDAKEAGETTLLNRDPGKGSEPVDEDDYAFWRTNFGMSVGSGAGGAAPSQKTVPEPSTAALAALAGIGLLFVQRRRALKLITA